VTAKQPQRASRLLASAADALQAMGDPTRATQLAMQSLLLTGKPPAVDAAWRAMPTLYDAAVATHGAADAANLRCCSPDQHRRQPAPPFSLRVAASAFKAAETKEDYDAMGRLAANAFTTLGQLRGRDTYSMPFYRHALDELATNRDPTLGEMAQRDPAFAARTLGTYTGLVDTLIRQSQAQFVADAREQLHSDYKIETLHASRAAARRRKRGGSDDGCRLAQLRSFGWLTLATPESYWRTSTRRPSLTSSDSFEMTRPLCGCCWTAATAPARHRPR
jgi:hypothetical protein